MSNQRTYGAHEEHWLSSLIAAPEWMLCSQTVSDVLIHQCSRTLTTAETCGRTRLKAEACLSPCAPGLPMIPRALAYTLRAAAHDAITNEHVSFATVSRCLVMVRTFRPAYVLLGLSTATPTCIRSAFGAVPGSKGAIIRDTRFSSPHGPHRFWLLVLHVCPMKTAAMLRWRAVLFLVHARSTGLNVPLYLSTQGGKYDVQCAQHVLYPDSVIATS